MFLQNKISVRIELDTSAGIAGRHDRRMRRVLREQFAVQLDAEDDYEGREGLRNNFPLPGLPILFIFSGASPHRK
jgi:hypothetical protein